MWRSLLLALAVNIAFPADAVVEEYMNESVSPCENFYQYACGNWTNVNRDVEHGDILSLLDADMNKKIGGFLESTRRKQRFLRKLKAFYRSCMDTKDYSVIEFLRSVTLKSGWAINQTAWKAELFNWLDVVAEIRRYGAQIFLEQTVMPKWDDPSEDIIYLDVAKVHPTTKSLILKALSRTLVNASATDTLVDQLLQFEQKLIHITSSKPESDENDGEIVLGFLNEALPLVNWVRYLTIVSGSEVPLTTQAIVQNTEIMTRLAEFLNGSQPSLVCHYIMVKFFQFLDQYSISEATQNECITTLHQSMPLAVDYIIEKHFYNRSSDQVVRVLFNHLRSSFLATTQELYPMHPDALQFLRSKVQSMDLVVGNTKRNLTRDDVDKYYDGLRLGDSFYTNLLGAFKWKMDKEFKSLSGSPVDVAYQWTVTPSPFFLQPKNRIIVPLSLLQDSIVGGSVARRTAILGFIIGHEFLHGFDQNGVNYDYQGSMVDSPLNANAQFLERLKCLEAHVIGMSTGEKIADLGGVRLVFRAFRRDLVRSGSSLVEKNEEGRARGEGLFIDFAQFFCGVDGKTHSGPDNHGSNELRVLQALKHFEDFSTTFGCPLGSAMNPEQKCRVW